MKTGISISMVIMIGIAFLGIATSVMAQPAAGPLDVQGLDQFLFSGTRSRAMGGTSTAVVDDATSLFSNPAGLSEVSRFEIRVSGTIQSIRRDQEQQWVPLKTLPGLSILFGGLSRTIKTPTDANGVPYTGWSTFQKQYDDITPDWKRHTSSAKPLEIVAAMPLTVADVPVTAGIGFSRIIDLDHYYQNNNAMTPYFGQERPYGQWSNPVDTVHLKWYQYIRSREGSVWGVTPGVSFGILSNLTVGGSVSFMFGSSDDREQRVERGHLSIAVNQGEPKNFLLDTVYYYQTKSGTSNYKGTMFTFGLLYQQPRYRIGFTIKPGMKITRTWNRDENSIDSTSKPLPVRVDSLASRNDYQSGKDYCRYPAVFSMGVMVKLTENLSVAFDYDIRNLADAEYQTADTTIHPWVGDKANWRIGAEYSISSLLSIRGGYREDIQAFAPDGSAIVDNPVSGEVYTLGAGFSLGDIDIDLAYEYSFLEYQDVYQSNVNYNKREYHQGSIGVAYRF